jgi:hypothetical protein
MDGRDETRKDTEDTTLVQMEEVERAIRSMSFVTKLSPVGRCSEQSWSWVSGFPEMPFLRRVWYLWKETRATSSSLEQGNDWRRNMANTLKLLLTKPPLVPKRVLMYIPQMCCRR